MSETGASEQHGRGSIMLLVVLAAAFALALKSPWWMMLQESPKNGTDHQILWAADIARSEGSNPFDTAVLDEVGRRAGRDATPFSASQPAAAALVGLTSTEDHSASYRRWLVVNILLLAACFAACVTLVRRLEPARFELMSAAALALAIFGFFESTVLALWFNSLNFATTCALIGTALMWRRLPIVAGLALGAAVVLKTSPALIVALAAAAGAWRVVGGALVGWGVVTAGAIAVLGLDVHLAWIEGALPRLGYAAFDEGAFNNAVHTWNYSLNGLISRAMITDGEIAHALWPIWGAVGVVVAVTVAAVLRASRRASIDGVWVVALGVATSLLISSVTWPHHLVFASVVWVWWTLRASSRTARVLGALALVALVPPMHVWGAPIVPEWEGHEWDARVRTLGLVALWVAVLVSSTEHPTRGSSGPARASAEPAHRLS